MFVGWLLRSTPALISRLHHVQARGRHVDMAAHTVRLRAARMGYGRRPLAAMVHRLWMRQFAAARAPAPDSLRRQGDRHPAAGTAACTARCPASATGHPV